MSIYVSIAAYEDRLLINTICDALAKARNEEDIVFGIALQYDTLPDLSFLNENQKRVIVYDPKTRPGIVEIRRTLKSMCQEDYFLQIDAHTDFYVDWDINLVEQLQLAKKLDNNEKVILSRHLDNFTGRTNSPSGRPIYGYKILDNYAGGNWLMVSQNFENQNRKSEKLIKSYNIGAGFIFADKKFVEEIDYDPYSSVAYEEVYLAYTLFMLGWSIYAPNLISYLAHDLKKSEIQFRNTTFSRYQTSPAGNLVKTFAGINRDTFDTYKEINTALIYNNFSKYEIKDAVKTTADFWTAIGLFDFYAGQRKTLSLLDQTQIKNV
jgi:hypothetical protein